MRRIMLLGALSVSLLVGPVMAEPKEGSGWHNRERIERQITRERERIYRDRDQHHRNRDRHNVDRDRHNRDRDQHNRDRDQHNRELDRRNRDLDRAQNQFYRRDHDRPSHNHRGHDDWRHERYSGRHNFWARERAWHQHHHHNGHWDTGVRFYVFQNRRYVYHPYFGDNDPFVRDEYGNCYRVAYDGDSRILHQVRSKYCRWS